MQEDIITDGALSDEDGGAAGSSGSLKDVLSKELGKTFPDDATAIKAIKDTFSYVGKAGQEIKRLESEILQAKAQGIGPEKIQTLEKDIQDMKFYSENPEYKPYKDFIETFGSNPADIVKDEKFKTWYSKVKAADEAEKSKSVVMGNSRIAGATDKLTKAKEQMASGNFEEAKDAATQAVLDAYGL